MRNINMNLNFRRNMNMNVKRTYGNNNSKKESLKDHVEEFREVFVKFKDSSSSHVVLEE